MYGAKSNKRAYLSGKATWEGGIQELQELCSLKAFGRHEWGEEAQALLAEMEEQEERERYKSLEETTERESYMCGLNAFKILGASIGTGVGLSSVAFFLCGSVPP